ncbi:MAG: response regulator [Bacteroidales bacterium]|nr:response regulator [Bacteroidales bacterium]
MKDTIINISLLFIEDDNEARIIISEMISRRVKEFYVAENAKEGIEIYKKHKPDLVISDIQMPVMNGLQMAEKLKQINPESKIIMMTAFTDTNYLLKSIDLQVDGYIIKPVLKTQLISTIKKQANVILLEKKAKEQEQKLIKSEEKYRQLFDLLPFGGEVIDTNGIITNCSISTARMLGYDIKQIIGKHITNFVDADSAKIFKQNFPKLLKGESLSLEGCMVHKNGSKINIIRAAQPILNADGEVIGMLALNIDITDRKKAEEAIRQQNIELQSRNEDLDDFSHIVAHDLKNPIGTMIGFAEIIFEKYSDLDKDSIMEYLEIILKDGNRTQQIINSLLLFANIRKADIKPEIINMEEIVSKSIKRLSSIIDNKNLKIKLPEIWLNTFGYSLWIEEVWTNYLSNAIKYGGSPPLIEIGCDMEKTKDLPGGMVRYWISDNGHGISENNQKLIFKKFERLNQIKTDGHGLGLSIVSRIIEKLNGQVWVESEIGKGSCFCFTLPFASIPLSETMNSNLHSSIIENSPQDIKPETLNLKVLIAEDEVFSDKHLSIVLKKLSKEILHTNNGEEAVKICRNNPDIDLVLMDIQMPKMNGYEATRKIREFNKDVIIIAQTAYVLAGDFKKSLKAGCNDHITKPINKNNLIKMIEQYF